jgi:hypothetical protein
MGLLRDSSFVLLRFIRSIQNHWKHWIALDIVSKALRLPFGHGALTSCLRFPAFAGMTFYRFYEFRNNAIIAINLLTGVICMK